MNKRTYGIINFIIILLALASQGVAQEPPQKVTEAANKGLSAFLNRIPPDKAQEFGFSKHDQLAQCYLGNPLQLHAISPSALSKYQPGDTISSIISSTKMWYFPVMLRKEAKAILVIDQVDNRWEAVSFGYTELARKLTRVKKQWPKLKGYNPQLIAVFQSREYLFTIPEKGPDNLTSLESTQLGRIPPKTVEDFSELDKLPNVINRLRPLVQKSIRSK